MSKRRINEFVLNMDTEFDDFAWLVGLFEGEGCFSVVRNKRLHYPVLAIAMTDRDVIVRASVLLNAKIYTQNRGKTKKGTLQKTIFSIQIVGSRALPTMMAFYPYMSKRRQNRIMEVFKLCGDGYLNRFLSRSVR